MCNLHELNFLNSNNEHLKLNTIKNIYICSEFFDCKYTVFKNTASSFQDEEEIRNIKFNI